MIPHVQMNMNELLHFTFLENKDAKIIFQSSMFQTSRDLFYFCVDFLIKGLVLMFSSDGNRLEMKNISLTELAAAKAKIAKLGIIMNVTFENVLDYGLEPKTLLRGDGQRLEDFVLYLKIEHVNYLIDFHIERV